MLGSSDCVIEMGDWAGEGFFFHFPCFFQAVSYYLNYIFLVVYFKEQKEKRESWRQLQS